MSVIYLDNHATTCCDPKVLAAMLPYFSEHYGNAASKTHAFGWTAEAAVDLGRERIADLLGANSNEIVFCSGATEANNLAIAGAARAYAQPGRHLVVAETEHPSVLDCARRLESEGWRLSVLPVNGLGLVEADALAATVTHATVLVSVMLVNNEIGVVQPISELVAAAKTANPDVLFHCDAVQAFGKIAVSVSELGVDMLSVSAHKMYGPKGIGALWRRRRPRLALQPLIEGGSHEWGLRSGTLPVPLIVGFGAACEIASEVMAADDERVGLLRDRLVAGLQQIDGCHVNGSMRDRIGGNLNVSFDGVAGDHLVVAMPEVAISTGSACASATAKPSHVLRAIGSTERAREAIRFGLGRFTTQPEIERVIELVRDAVERLRQEKI